MQGKRSTSIQVYSWSFINPNKMVFAGRDRAALAGKLVSTSLLIDHLERETQYDLGKCLIDFGQRIVNIQDIHWANEVQGRFF